MKTAVASELATRYSLLDTSAPSGFDYLGLSGTRRFTDTTLPAGAGEAIYQVTAVRSTRRGDPARFTVNLGVGGLAASRAGAA